MAGTLDSGRQMTLLAFGQPGFLTGLNLTVCVNETLKRLKIFVVEIRNISPRFKYLCHSYEYSFLKLLFIKKECRPD